MHEKVCYKCGNKSVVVKLSSTKDMCRSCAGAMSKGHGKYKGLSQEPVYYSWKSMFHRCRTCKPYLQKGISVCGEWSDFLIFREWSITTGYKKGLHLDRINSNKNYCPDNCRWVTGRINSSRIQAITLVDIELIIEKYKNGLSAENILKVFYN